MAFEASLRHHGIQVLSHSGDLGWSATIPTIGWLPDFQYIRMPEFFSASSLKIRNNHFRRFCKNCSTILLSSSDAQNDLEKFAPRTLSRSHVLRFSSGLSDISNILPLEILLRRHGLPRHYFYLPNQFWVHKNHTVVINALAILKSMGRDVTVVATGSPHDPRQARYFDTLHEHAVALGVETNFRSLGLLPYDDVRGLMKHSIAVINPSLFEGWSTTVEEAKSQGKKILLSDIPVHKEQAPERGVYFPPHRPDVLADVLWQTLGTFDPTIETKYEKEASRVLPGRLCEFATHYENIVFDTLRGYEFSRRSRFQALGISS